MTELLRLREENAALRRELLEQWAENHAEHCGCPEPEQNGRCMWRKPAVLAEQPQ